MAAGADGLQVGPGLGGFPLEVPGGDCEISRVCASRLAVWLRSLEKARSSGFDLTFQTRKIHYALLWHLRIGV